MRDFGTDIPNECSIPPSQQDLAVAVLTYDAIDGALRDRWRDLDGNLAFPNPYFAEWFLRPALAHLDPARTVRLCVVSRVEDGAMIALFPFDVGDRYAKLPLNYISIWRHPHAYNGTPLIRQGYESAAFAAIFDWLDARPFGARFLRLTQLPYDPPVEEMVGDACAQAERIPREQSRIERACLAAEGDYDALMAEAMPGKKRKELRRQARRFEELGDARFVDLSTSGASIEALVEAYVALENAGWKAAAAHGEPLARSESECAFFAEAMQAGARAGAISCLSLTLDSKSTAMLFCLRSGRHLSAFKTSYDESHAAYSPGMRLLMEATRHALAEPGIEMVDSCARPGHPVVDRLWPGRLPIVQLNIPTGHARDATLLDLAAAAERAKNRVTKTPA